MSLNSAKMMPQCAYILKYIHLNIFTNIYIYTLFTHGILYDYIKIHQLGILWLSCMNILIIRHVAPCSTSPCLVPVPPLRQSPARCLVHMGMYCYTIRSWWYFRNGWCLSHTARLISAINIIIIGPDGDIINGYRYGFADCFMEYLWNCDYFKDVQSRDRDVPVFLASENHRMDCFARRLRACENGIPSWCCSLGLLRFPLYYSGSGTRFRPGQLLGIGFVVGDSGFVGRSLCSGHGTWNIRSTCSASLGPRATQCEWWGWVSTRSRRFGFGDGDQRIGHGCFSNVSCGWSRMVAVREGRDEVGTTMMTRRGTSTRDKLEFLRHGMVPHPLRTTWSGRDFAGHN